MSKWLVPPLLFALLPNPLLTGQNTGSLTLLTEPEAEVLWQGVSLGLAGEDGRLQIQGIPRGTYQVLVIKTGFLAESREIEIHAGAQQIEFHLTPLADRTLPEIPTSDQEVTPPLPSANEGPVAPVLAPTPANPAEAETRIEPDLHPSAPDRSPGEASFLSPASRVPEKDNPQHPVRNLDKSPEGRRPDVDTAIQVPSTVPTSPDSESDLRIVVWWLIALVVGVSSFRLLHKRNQRERASREEAVSRFTRVLSPNQEKQE